VDDESAYGDSEKQGVEHLIIDGALCTLSAIPRGWSDMVLFSAMVLISRLDDSKTKVDRVLFDTGALSANYVSRQCYENLKNKIETRDIFQQKTRVRMADSVTVQETDTTMRLSLEFDDTAGSTVCYTRRFVVLDMEHNDIIIGLHAIVGDLWPFFVISVEQRHAARPFGRDDYVCSHVDELIEP
jgi:predicted ATPase